MAPLTGFLSNARYPRFLVDAYGADPTGVNDSTAAFQAAIADATTQVQGTNYSGNAYSGAMVEAGFGIYALQPGQVVIDDFRVGFMGQGKSVTTLRNHGTGTGDIIWITDTTANTTTSIRSAPVFGFHISGWIATTPCNGLHYGDRPFATVRDVSSDGFQKGGRSFWFRNDNGNLSEKLWLDLTANSSTTLFDFDGSNGSATQTSFDYSMMSLSGTVISETGYTQCGILFQNNAHSVGSNITLVGNANAQSGFTAVVLQVGAIGSATDTARIANGFLTINIECDGSAGTMTDINVGAAAQLYNLMVDLNFITASGTFAAGIITGWATMEGTVNAPSLAALSSASGTPTSYILTTGGLSTGVYNNQFVPLAKVTGNTTLNRNEDCVVTSGSPTITVSNHYGSKNTVVNQGSGTVTTTPSAGTLYGITGGTGNGTLTPGQSATYKGDGTNVYRII